MRLPPLGSNWEPSVKQYRWVGDSENITLIMNGLCIELSVLSKLARSILSGRGGVSHKEMNERVEGKGFTLRCLPQ